MKRALVVGFVAITFLAALPAQAKSFWIDHADVDVTVNSDGSLDIVELITFNFDGSFSGAYRDIPIGPGGAVDSITVGDDRVVYDVGGCTALRCSDLPGTYGVEQHNDFVRVVWHHASSDELRTFRLSYHMTGLAVAWDDIVDVNLKVWGDQWSVGLDSLEARMHLPSGLSEGDVRVWGHPYGVNGVTSLGEGNINPTLTASGVPSEQWVEMRITFPTSSLESTEGATRISGTGLGGVLDEELRFADEASDARTAALTECSSVRVVSTRRTSRQPCSI